MVCVFAVAVRSWTERNREWTLEDLENKANEVLKRIIDPEVGENVVDLGLVYGVGAAGSTLRVTMTMTSPVCPMTESIRDEARRELAAEFPEYAEVVVDVVFNPPWSPDMMSAAARKRFQGG